MEPAFATSSKSWYPCCFHGHQPLSCCHGNFCHCYFKHKDSGKLFCRPVPLINQCLCVLVCDVTSSKACSCRSCCCRISSCLCSSSSCLRIYSYPISTQVSMRRSQSESTKVDEKQIGAQATSDISRAGNRRK